MTETVDTYIKAKSWAVMKAFLVTETDGQLMPAVNFQHLITPMRGRAATAAVGKEGEADYVPAQPQAGHPDYWYTCIRSDTAIELPSGIEACSVEEGSSVVGVWA